jgi:recombination protein RecT
MSDEEQMRKTMQTHILNMAEEFERALPGKIGVERMMRIAMTAILKTPTLAMCEPVSFMGSLLQALQLGLEVNTPLGQAYLIPRKRKDRNGQFLCWECNFQIGYQGLLDLCYRYGKYRVITAEVVYEGDYFDYRYGTKQFLDHRPEGKKGAKPIKVWALYQLENGGERFMVWTWDEAMAHGEEFSDSFNKDKPWASPWLSNETAQKEMAKKSVLKTLLKYAPKSVEGQIEAASYADGHAVIAEKVDEMDGIRLAFDVKQISAPDPKMQETMNWINRAGKQPEEDAEAVLVSQDRAGEPAQAVAATSPPPQYAGNGTGRSSSSALFPADEAQDLEESVEPPVFKKGGK